jgi:hypothetical protein
MATLPEGMADKAGHIDLSLTYDEVIDKFRTSLRAIDPGLPNLVDFKLQVQRNNLMSLVREADERIQKYDHIYPYIKELCKDQTINPAWHAKIEKVLNWVLKKGSGRNRVLNRELKQAWITYIILLSCSMIDKGANRPTAGGKHLFLKVERGNLIGFTGKN